jgi:hypothetical protein
MGIKEKMMENMMNNMSKEEKMEMMEKMMDSFFSGMSDEEKKEMMNNMMPKMVQNMMGGNGGGSMMGMMGNMMSSMMKGKTNTDDNGFNPMNMCKEMMSNIRQSSKIATLSTPEVQGLFEDWVEQIENEIINFIKEKETYNIEEIAKNFKISKESAYYFLTRLAQKGKINIKVEK